MSGAWAVVWVGQDLEVHTAWRQTWRAAVTWATSLADCGRPPMSPPRVISQATWVAEHQKVVW